MITKVHAYTDSKGVPHASLEHAQKSELGIILGSLERGGESRLVNVHELIELLVKDKEKIVDILTTKPNSLVKARRVNGGTKTRAKKSTRYEAEQFPLPMEDSPKPAA